TVLSFFPAGALQYHHSGFTDLYTSISQNWVGCGTAWDLYALLVKEASSFLFRQDNKGFTDKIETYRKNHATGDVELSVLDDRRELKLVLEVTDIIDELKMIRHLTEKQREVLKALATALKRLSPSEQQFIQLTNHNHVGDALGIDAESIKILAQGVHGIARDTLVLADDTLVSLITELEIMRNDADYAHKMLLDLLDLKQKPAALAEARATSQQGRVIMSFTIVTIVFLPLSFFSSYFGQNVREISGEAGNPSSGDLWKIGGKLCHPHGTVPLSVVVILFALLIAYLVTRPVSCGVSLSGLGKTPRLDRYLGKELKDTVV
ncbi:hypothetical protein QBC35DRAFT_389598, partial [Podospora australis]